LPALLNHAIASMVNGQVVKVICQTCYTEHAYLRGEGGKKKAAPRTTLFDQVLSKVSPSESESEPVAAPAKKKAPPPKPVKAKEPPAPDAPVPEKKMPEPARYISRHKTRPPRRSK
jgi:hypothetical protein